MAKIEIPPLIVFLLFVPFSSFVNTKEEKVNRPRPPFGRTPYAEASVRGGFRAELNDDKMRVYRRIPTGGGRQSQGRDVPRGIANL